MELWTKAFAVIGRTATLAMVVLLVGILWARFDEWREKKRYEYRIKHRFDKPPLAKCYCVDCRWYGDGPYPESCGRAGVDRLFGPDEFCSDADPKEMKKG